MENEFYSDGANAFDQITGIFVVRCDDGNVGHRYDRAREGAGANASPGGRADYTVI